MYDNNLEESELMKSNFFTTIKKQIKDPVNTIEEAKVRRKIFKKYLLILLAADVFFGFLQVVDIPVLSTICTLLCLLTILITFGDILLIVVAGKLIRKFKNLYCDSCNTRITYDKNVSYRVINTRSTMSSGDNHAVLKGYATVEITCICQKCGKAKTFTHEFRTDVTRATDNTGDSHGDSIENLVIGYFGNVVQV